MSFLYPRTTAVTRPGKLSSTAAGPQGQSPSGQQAKETPVATGLPASIQAKTAGGQNKVGLPADGGGSLIWRVLIPLGSAALGLIQARDIITDDLGVRYQVISPYWNSLGYNLICQRLEA